MRLADSFPQNANAKLHIIFQISITFTSKIDIHGDFFISRHTLIIINSVIYVTILQHLA